MSNKGLSSFMVAFMIAGTLIGAGFASGREIWQFFGVFGSWGYVGALIAGIVFILFGLMAVQVARQLETNDMGRVVVPVDSRNLAHLVGSFMALVLFTVLVMMSAAGGAFLNQQYGLPRSAGGLLIIILVLATVLGGFERISRVFRFIIPLLLLVVTLTSFYIILSPMELSTISAEIKPSPLAPNWPVSTILYVSLIMLAAIPIISTASIFAKSRKDAMAGVLLGGLAFTALMIILTAVTQKDMAFSQAMDMPLLAYTKRLSPFSNLVYGIILFFAIYASATTNYYAVTTRFKEGKKKRYIVVGLALIAFFFGLVGFSNVVAYMLPAEGAFGIIILFMFIVHYFRLRRQEDK